MRTLVSLLVLTLVVSGTAVERLHARHQIRDRAARDRTSTPHGASCWYEHGQQIRIPSIEALPGGPTGANRPAAHRDGSVRIDRAHRLPTVATRLVRPHDPSHLHSYTLLI